LFLDEMADNAIVLETNLASSLTFRCEICKIEFPTKLALAGHKAGKHRAHKCSICKENFDSGGKLGRHKIEVHGYTREQLGWGLTGGWNKGRGRVEEFSRVVASHSNPEFMSKLNAPEYAKLTVRRFHEEVVILKEKDLQRRGYRTFNTSNYTHHCRIPDIIAISPEGKVIAFELETIKPYKCSPESLRKKYTPLLMKDKFFDDVVVVGFKNDS
jgi:hypothetical protein